MVFVKKAKDLANIRSINRIFDIWQSANAYNYARFIVSTSIVVSSFMIVFDYMFVGANSLPFILGRLVCICTSIPLLLLVRNWRAKYSTVESKAKRMFLLTPPVFIFTGIYYFYLFALGEHKFEVYYIGILLVIIFSSFLLHRFWREQYIYNLTFISLSAVLINFVASKADYLLIIIVTHLVSFVSFGYLRRDFVGGLFARFNLLSTMVPARFAELILISSESTKVEDLLRPTGRFTACLCADWRNFQALTNRKTAQEISSMLEKYYDLVLEELTKLVPSNNYFFNWTADELFIIFFNETDDRQSVVTDALSFAKALSGTVYEQIQSEFKGEIIYDVGLSSGIGLLGLQGPKGLKKTTIAGEVAGRAKRYQEEAKYLRKTSMHDSSPILIMDSEIMQEPAVTFLFKETELKEIIATAKDIAGKPCLLWTKKQPAKLKLAS